MRAAPLLAFAVLLAGCAAPIPAGDAAAPQEDILSLAFSPASIAIPSCSDACAEPSVAADAAGRIYVSTQRGESLSRSDDGGATWLSLDTPPVAPGAPPPVPTEPIEPLVENVNLRIVNRADTLVQTDPTGRLFWTSIVGAAQGIQVARSDDAGASWTSNVWVSVANDPSLAPGVTDRQWLAFGPSGEVYLTYFQIPSGLWIARSDDGGATFGGWTRFAPTEERQTLGFESLPLVLPSGRVVIAFLAGPPVFTQPQRTPSAVRAAASDDGGATWEIVDVHVPDGAAASDTSPMLARLDDGRIAAAWRQPSPDAALLLSFSSDEGATWSEPVGWAQGVSGEEVPALRASSRGLVAAWHDEDHRLLASRDGGEPMVVADVGWADSDFVFLDAMPDGRIVTTFAREGVVYVVAERSAAS